MRGNQPGPAEGDMSLLQAAPHAIPDPPDGVTLRGGAGADTLTGGDGNDVLLGRGGDDSLDGRAGDDLLHGGQGNDSISNGAASGPFGGGDTVCGGGGDDLLRILSYDHTQVFGGSGNDTISIRALYSSTVTAHGGAGDDFLKGDWERDALYGGAGNDTLFGDDSFDDNAPDTLEGGAGDDSLDGGRGDDSLNGGAGNDTILDGGGADLVLLSRGDDRVENTLDAARDVFVWTALGPPRSSPEHDSLAVFDLQGDTGDQLDFSALGSDLVAVLSDDGAGGGSIAIFANEALHARGRPGLLVSWDSATGPVASISIGEGADAAIRIGAGWHVHDGASGALIA